MGRAGIAVITVAGAVGFGLALESLGSTSPWLLLMAGPGLAAFGFIVTRGPLVCLAAFVVADVLGLYSNSLVAAGPAQVRFIDVFWVALVVWMLVIRQRDGAQPGRNVGQPVLAFWLIALGLSLFPVVVRAPGLISDYGVSWVRLVQTFSLVWLVPYSVRRLKDAEYVIGVVVLAATAEIVRAIVNALLTGSTAARLQAGNNTNTEGLLSALLIIAALHAPVPRRRGLRVAILIIGLVGLFMSKSLGATAAVVGSLGIFGFHRPTDGGPGSRPSLLLPVRIILLVVAGVILASTFRAENLPSSKYFGSSSTAARVVLATAGLELFVTHPIVGVGFQRSSLEVTSEHVTERLERRFGDTVDPVNIPTTNRTSGVHNLYVQMLAEGGLLASLALLAFLFACGRGIKAAFHDLRSSPPGRDVVHACMVLLVVIAIWWNDNGLFGGQPEGVITATLIGILASTTFAQRSNPAHQVAPHPTE